MFSHNKALLFIIFAAILLLPLSAYAAEGDEYGNCVSPLQSYKCYNIEETPKCPNARTDFIAGYCNGPANIKCCAPAETKLLKIRNFQVLVSGNIKCWIKVESRGLVTRDEAVECDSYEIVTVGPNSDCRHEGEETCKVVTGGITGSLLADERTYNIKFPENEQETSRYGRCKAPYNEFFCQDPSLKGTCPDGEFISGYCSDTSNSIKCCVITENAKKEGKLFQQFADGFTIKNVDSIEAKLRSIQSESKVKVIIEIYTDIKGDPPKLGSDKFYFTYGLGKDPKQFDMLLMYSIRVNRFYFVKNPSCGLSNQRINSIVSNAEVKKALAAEDYGKALDLVAGLLAKEIKEKVKTSPAECKTGAPKESLFCQEACDSGLFSSCDAAKCAELGCKWHKKYKICQGIEFYESEATITARLSAVKSGFKGFIRRDPICLGVNCAGYVTRAHEYIFGIGKHFITGVGGNAWNIPKNVRDRDGTVRWFDWRNGEIFTDYNSLLPGDIIAFHYTESDFRPNVLHQTEDETRPRYGHERGNTQDIDFTHVALYLGKSGDEHIITHLYHPPGCLECDPIRIESVESFLNKFGNVFKIRAVISPDQEKLYRIGLPDSREVRFKRYTIKKGDTLADIVGRDETVMWLTADYNMLIENNLLDKYIGRPIIIPLSTPSKYSYERLLDPEYTSLQKILTELIKERAKYKGVSINSPEIWAQTIISNMPYKAPEYIALTTAIVDMTSFDVNPTSTRPFLGYDVSEEWVRDLDVSTLNVRSYSVGCMVVQLCKAEQIAKENNKKSSTSSVYNELKTLDGCIFYGTRLIKIISSGLSSGIVKNDEDALTVLVEYNKGEFFVRNSILQIQISDLLGPRLMMETAGFERFSLKDRTADGDFRLYDRCLKEDETTKSERAVKKLIEVYKLPITNDELKRSLDAEKTKEFEQTRIYGEIKRLWQTNIGKSLSFDQVHPEFKNELSTLFKFNLDVYKFYIAGLKIDKSLEA